MLTFVKPRLVVSLCLTGEPVRYDGSRVKDDFVEKLLLFIEPIGVCPEVALGLGVPRDKIVVIKGGKVIQPSTGRDLTADLNLFSESFLKTLPAVDGFLLKAKSPSCGFSRTKTYSDTEGKRFAGFGKGLFALKVLERFKDYPAEDELTLKSKKRKLRFLVSIFALALVRSGKAEELFELTDHHLRVFAPKYRKRLMSVKGENFRRLFVRALGKFPQGVLEELAFEIVPSDLIRE